MPAFPTRRLILAMALSVAAALTFTACGDDDSAEAGDGAAIEVTATACDAYVGLGGAFAGDPAAAGDLVAEFESTAPDALADEAATIAATYTTLGEGGDPAVLSEADYLAAAGAVADAYFDGCETSAVLDVEGVDYGFEGLPDEVAAGRVGIRFTNATEHDEPHELVLFRIADGVTATADELLELPEEEAYDQMAMAGVVFADAPGSESAAMFDLEPGRYVAICFIPIGGGEDGPPHFTGGMVAELQVS